jgi:hypothetical protein
VGSISSFLHPVVSITTIFGGEVNRDSIFFKYFSLIKNKKHSINTVAIDGAPNYTVRLRAHTNELIAALTEPPLHERLRRY